MTKPDKDVNLKCGHMIYMPDALKNLSFPCPMCEDEDRGNVKRPTPFDEGVDKSKKGW